MGQYIMHGFLILLSTFIGYSIASKLFVAGGGWGGLVGFVVGGCMAALGLYLELQAAKRFFWGLVGVVLGFLTGGFLNVAIEPLFAWNAAGFLIWKGFSLLVCSYVGLISALRIEKEPALFRRGETQGVSNNKILDTSVIIDGRIADLCETGFLEGVYIIPQFILQELQHIADSSDSLKRARGRRGLDVLHTLQKMVNLDVRIVDDDFPSIREVDAKIVALAKVLSAKVITNDLNLNKVAELQGVRVLNINQLCNSLRPVVLPGESMKVFILKEGKESGQGVGYLDDGTMIVVDDARRWIGKSLDVVVTSVLQTTAGRMIFTRVREELEREELRVMRNH